MRKSLKYILLIVAAIPAIAWAACEAVGRCEPGADCCPSGPCCPGPCCQPR